MSTSATIIIDGLTSISADALLGDESLPSPLWILRVESSALIFRSSADLDRLIAALYDAKAKMVALAPPAVDALPKCAVCKDAGWVYSYEGGADRPRVERQCPVTENHR